MANTVNILGFANTFGDWIVATNADSNEINSIGKYDWTKDSGTLFLNGTGTSLSVSNNAIVAGQLQVTGTSSSATIDNNLTVGKQVYLTNTTQSLVASGSITSNGTIYATNTGTSLSVSNNSTLGGTLTVSGSTIISNTINVLLATTLQNSLSVGAGAAITGNVSITANTYTSFLTANNRINAGQLTVTSNGNFNGSIIASVSAVVNGYDVVPYILGAFVQANSAYGSQNVTGTYANSAYYTANSAQLYANGAFLQANAAYGSQNTTGTYANSAYYTANSAQLYANGAFVQANAAFISSNAINLTQNTSITAAFLQANAAYASQNTTGTYANSAYSSQNVTGTYANSAYLFANNLQSGAQTFNNMTLTGTSLSATNAVGAFSSLTTSGGLTVGGTFTINGTTVYTTNNFVINANTNTPVISYFSINRGTANNQPNGIPNANAAIRWYETGKYFDILDVNNGTQYSQIMTANMISDSTTSTSTTTVPTNKNLTASFLQSNSAFLQANAAYGSQNTTGTYANSAYLAANGANANAITTGTYANTAITNAATADSKAVTAGSYANSAYTAANSALTTSNAIDLTQNTSITAAFTQANTATTNAATADSKAVTAGSYANSAYTQANTATTNAATADSKAITSGSYANSAYTAANTADSKAVSAGSYANSAYTQANTATTNASTADSKAVSAGSYANSAFTTANNALPKTGGTLSGDLGITGNLFVNGTSSYINVATFQTVDSLIKLAANNLSDTIDIGFYGQYVSVGTKYTGLVRSAASNYYLFQGITTDPTSNSVGAIAFANYGTLNANIAAGQITSSQAIPVTSGGTGVTSSTGTGSVVLSTSPTFTTPALGTPSSGNLANCTFPTLNQNTTGTAAGLSATLAVASGGTGVTTSTGTGSNVLSTSPTLVTPLLGTPTSGNLANCTFPTLNQDTTGSSASCTGNAATATTAGSATTFTSTSQNSQFNSIGIGTAASATAGEIRATNNITAYYSDNRLKTKLGNITGALSKVKSLNGFYYEANQTAQDLGYKVKREVGVSAQEVQSILPEIVSPAPIDAQYLTIDYERLVPLLIEAIKELSDQVEELKAKLP